MKKANSYFFLAGVADHILAEFHHDLHISKITFSHRDDKRSDCLILLIEPRSEDKHYVLHYLITVKGEELPVSKSEPIPQDKIYGVIAAMANEVIPE